MRCTLPLTTAQSEYFADQFYYQLVPEEYVRLEVWFRAIYGYHLGRADGRWYVHFSSEVEMVEFKLRHLDA